MKKKVPDRKAPFIGKLIQNIKRPPFSGSSIMDEIRKSHSFKKTGKLWTRPINGRIFTVTAN